MRIGHQPTIHIRNHNDPIFVIDSHFEKYYTHFIEVTPTCAYFMETLRLVDQDTRIFPRVFFLFPQKRRLTQWIQD
jgi:hypothetical protein